MSTTRAKHVADWLSDNPAPIHATDVAAWNKRVKVELGKRHLDDLVGLLEHGDLEQQYQAVAAARALGAQVWAEGTEPQMAWRIRLPADADERLITPQQQLNG